MTTAITLARMNATTCSKRLVEGRDGPFSPEKYQRSGRPLISALGRARSSLPLVYLHAGSSKPRAPPALDLIEEVEDHGGGLGARPEVALSRASRRARKRSRAPKRHAVSSGPSGDRTPTSTSSTIAHLGPAGLDHLL